MTDVPNHLLASMPGGARFSAARAANTDPILYREQATSKLRCLTSKSLHPPYSCRPTSCPDDDRTPSRAKHVWRSWASYSSARPEDGVFGKTKNFPSR